MTYSKSYSASELYRQRELTRSTGAFVAGGLLTAAIILMLIFGALGAIPYWSKCLACGMIVGSLLITDRWVMVIQLEDYRDQDSVEWANITLTLALGGLLSLLCAVGLLFS